MPYPMLNKHSEAQYLELEKNYFNLYNFLQSLLTITEGEDLDSDSKRLIHFSALCMRINQAVEEYAEFTSKVRESMFKGDSATTTPIPEPSGDVQIIEYREPKTIIVLKVNKKEYGHIICNLLKFVRYFTIWIVK